MLSPLPHFRGKVRLGLALHRYLGLDTHHLQYEVRLRRPVNYRAKLDLHSVMQRMAYFMGGYEPDTVKFLHNCYSGTGYFLDIGANVGLISIPFALLTNESKQHDGVLIHCIDPIPTNIESLKHNIWLNNLEDSIQTVCQGVGDYEMDVEIQIEGNQKLGEGTGTANILPADSAHPCERVEIQITTLDELILQGKLPKNCSLVKIDVDGYDLKVLQGAKILMAESRPLIYGEFMRHCLSWHQQTHSDVVDFAKQYDYEVYVRERDAWKFQHHSIYQGTQDLLLIPFESLNRYAWCFE